MPRPKVSDEARQRTAKACLYCQSTKQKCDGKLPCNPCVRRERVSQCAYSDHVRSYGHRRQRKAVHRRVPEKPSKPSKQGDTGTSGTDKGDGMIEIAVPKLPRSLYDTRGKVVYLGDCSALSFLQNIQDLIEQEIQPASMGSTWREFEELPPDPDERGLSYAGNVHDLRQLIQTFFAATCGILDIIEPAEVEDLLNQWTQGSLDQHRGGEAILHLIFAYAAQAQASCALSQKRAYSFYHHGRRIALLQLTDDPSTETVQAFLLISLYMLGCSRRNGAFLNLGIAISAAKALGFHRQETNISFPEHESRLRTRIWASLTYHDLFFCAMMGRTSATITTDCTIQPSHPIPQPPLTPISDQELALRQSAHAFSFMDRTVNEIYTKRTVSMGALKHMARDLQSAIRAIPPNLQSISISPVSQKNTLLRNANILCSYHFSMMLLTRPFLVAKFRAHLNTTHTQQQPAIEPENENALLYADITANAAACVDAATRTVNVLHNLLSGEALLLNMPLTVAWTFVSALTICSAYFGQLGTATANESAIVQAGHILDHFAVSSPQARRYSAILRKLSDAATRRGKGGDHLPTAFPAESSFFNSMQRNQSQGGESQGQGHGHGITEPVAMGTDREKDLVGVQSQGADYAGGLALDESWDLGVDVGLFPLDLGNADSIWDINWVGSLM